MNLSLTWSTIILLLPPMRLWLAITMGKTTTCGFTMCDFYVRFFIIDQMRWVELRLDLDKKWTWFNIVNTVFEVQSEHISAYSELSSFPSIICACMGEQLVTLDLAAFWMFLCCWCWTHTLPLSPVQCWMWHDDSCWSSWGMGNLRGFMTAVDIYVILSRSRHHF